VQRDIQTEVVLCPNCNEEVPKTLYCLNCGYPLYKIEQTEAEEPVASIEETPEQMEAEPAIEPDLDQEVSPIEEEVEVPLEPVIDATEAEGSQTIPVEEPEEPAEMVELVEAETAQGEIEAETMLVQEPENLKSDVPETETTAIEEEPSEIVEEAVAEVVDETGDTEETQVVEEILEEPVAEAPLEEEVQEAAPEFEPDPLVKMVMERLAKNISLRVRLVNLLREDDVKEATFNRLFESYAARGERWMNQRNEMLERCRYDLDAMEKAFIEAKTSLEELEIRKTIGDASEEEYAAKAPAFEWDIRSLDDELRHRKSEIAYLEDLTRVMSTEEVQALNTMAENCHGAIDELVESEKVSPETAARIKAALEEALGFLASSGCK